MLNYAKYLLDYRVLLIFLFYWIYKNIIFATIQILLYAKQGFTIDYYFPILGHLVRLRKAEKIHGDPSYF